MLPETLSLVNKAIEQSQLPASECPTLIDGAKSNEKALKNWLGVHQKSMGQHPAKDALARKIAFYMVQAPKADGLIGAAFALLYPHSTLRILHPIHPQQFLEGDFTITGTQSEIVVLHAVSEVFHPIYSVEQISSAIIQFEAWAKTLQEPHDKTAPLFMARYSEYLSVQHLLKTMQKNIPLTRENIPAMIQSLNYRQSKTGFTGNPYLPYNIFCAQLAWLCVDYAKENVQEQFWKILYPEISQVFDGDENKTWPHYGEALLDGDCLINYRSVYEQGKAKPEERETILSQLSLTTQTRIKSFVAGHSVFWSGLDKELLDYRSTHAQPSMNFTRVNHYLDFFNQVYQWLDHYQKGNNAQSEEDIGEEGAFVMIPYQARMIDFKKFVLLKPPGSPLKILCSQPHKFNLGTDEVQASLLDIITNLTETKNDRLSHATRSCFQRNTKALHCILKDPALQHELKNMRFIFNPRAESVEGKLRFEGNDALSYANAHLQAVNYQHKSESELRSYASKALEQGYDMHDIVAAYKTILQQQGRNYSSLIGKTVRGITERVHNFVFNLGIDRLDAQQEFLRFFYGDGTWILLCDLENLDKDAPGFLAKICEHCYMPDEISDYIIAALKIIEAQSLPVSPKHLMSWLNALDQHAQEKNHSLIVRILVAKCFVNRKIDYNFFIWGVPTRYYPALLENIKIEYGYFDIFALGTALNLSYPDISAFHWLIKIGTMFESDYNILIRSLNQENNKKILKAVDALVIRDLAVKGKVFGYFKPFQILLKIFENYTNTAMPEEIKTAINQFVGDLPKEIVKEHYNLLSNGLISQGQSQKQVFIPSTLPLQLRLNFIRKLLLCDIEMEESVVQKMIDAFPNETMNDEDEAGYQQLFKLLFKTFADYSRISKLFIKNKLSAANKLYPLFYNVVEMKFKEFTSIAQAISWMACDDPHINKIIRDYLLQQVTDKKHFTCTAHFIALLKQTSIQEWHAWLIELWLKQHPQTTRKEFNEIMPYLGNGQQLIQSHQIFGYDITVLRIRNIRQLNSELVKVSAMHHETDKAKTRRENLILHAMDRLLESTFDYLEVINHLDIIEQQTLIAHWIKQCPHTCLTEFNEMLGYANYKQVIEAYHAFGECILEDINSPHDLCQFLCYASDHHIQLCLDRHAPNLKSFILQWTVGNGDYSIGRNGIYNEQIKQILERYIEQNSEKFFPEETLTRDLAAFKLQRCKRVVVKQANQMKQKNPVRVQNDSYEKIKKIIKMIKTPPTYQEPEVLKKESFEFILGMEIIDRFFPTLYDEILKQDLSDQHDSLGRLNQFVHSRFFQQIQSILAELQDQIDQTEDDSEKQQLVAVQLQLTETIKKTFHQIGTNHKIDMITIQTQTKSSMLVITAKIAQEYRIAKQENTFNGYLKFLWRQLLALFTDHYDGSNLYHREYFPSYQTYKSVNSHIHRKCQIKQEVETLPIVVVTI